MDIWVIIAYVFGLLALLIIVRLFPFPFKVLLKLVYNGLLGGVILVLFNLAGGLFGFIIALNVASAFTAGLLGVPGVILLAALKFILP